MEPITAFSLKDQPTLRLVTNYSPLSQSPLSACNSGHHHCHKTTMWVMVSSFMVRAEILVIVRYQRAAEGTQAQPVHSNCAGRPNALIGKSASASAQHFVIHVSVDTLTFQRSDFWRKHLTL